MIKNHSEKYWKKIYEKDSLDIFDNPICNSCRTENLEKKWHMGYPVPLNYVGKKFPSDYYKILFIGKESYGGHEINKSKKIDYFDYFSYKRTRDLYFNLDDDDYYSPFWGWAREITEEIIGKGDNSFHHIAWSNLIKCKLGNSDLEESSCILVGKRDKYCIQDAKWVFKEIKQLKPKNIIVFAGVDKTFRLARLFLGDEKFINVVDKNGKLSDRNLFFTHLKNGDQRIIVTNHPQYSHTSLKKKIINVVSNNDWSGSVSWNLPV
jgi:hypothetical protein